MKKILAAILGLALCAQAQIVYLYHADLVSPHYNGDYGEVLIYESGGMYVFDINWTEIGIAGGNQDSVYVNSTFGYFGATLDSNPDTFAFPASYWQNTYEPLLGQDINLNRGGDMANGAVGTIYPMGIVPEPAIAGTLFGLGLIGAYAIRRRRLLPLACLALLLAVPTFAADDDPIAVDPATSVTETTTTLPAEWTITITSTPVVKVDGVNVGNVTKVLLTRKVVTETRTIADGVQVGDVRTSTREVTRDVTEYVRTTRLTDTGFWRLDFNTNKFTIPALIWRNTTEPEVTP